MNVEFWIKVAAKKRGIHWVSGPVTATKGKPDTSSNEVAIKISLDIPSAVFEKPQFHAQITVDENSVAAPIVDASVASNIAEILSQQLGVKVRVESEKPD